MKIITEVILFGIWGLLAFALWPLSILKGIVLGITIGYMLLQAIILSRAQSLIQLQLVGLKMAVQNIHDSELLMKALSQVLKTGPINHITATPTELH